MKIGRPALLGLLLLSLFMLNGCYLLTQGVYLLKYTYQAKDIPSLLEGNELDPAVRRMLEEVLRVQEFAVRDLGLKRNRNYTRYADTGREYLVNVVTASMSDSFTPYTWKFPIVGEVPYKGFYRREDALELAGKLKAKNYDVIVRQVDAFSTLGFLADPVYNFMSGYSSFRLAELIIHEQTHATLFLKNEIQFNEELATFVGFEGAIQYLERQGHSIDALHTERMEERRDRESYFVLMRELYKELDVIYQQPVPRADKLVRKAEIYEAFRQRMETGYGDYFQGDGYRFLAERTLNNAYLITQNIYTSDLSLYEAVFARYGRDMKQFITAVKEAVKQQKDPKAAMRDLLH